VFSVENWAEIRPKQPYAPDDRSSVRIVLLCITEVDGSSGSSRVRTGLLESSARICRGPAHALLALLFVVAVAIQFLLARPCCPWRRNHGGAPAMGLRRPPPRTDSDVTSAPRSRPLCQHGYDAGHRNERGQPNAAASRS